MQSRRSTPSVEAIPQRPIFGWKSLSGGKEQTSPSVDQISHLRLVTSGRAAIFLALRELNLPAGSLVLVPTYHCPTMVAPILLAGAKPQYFGTDALGRPNLQDLGDGLADGVRAMILPHYFGLPQSMAATRAWCDEHGVALIEDCAHSFFGQAGERAVGEWGDYATASVTKFFPVPEAGLLVSRHRSVEATRLRPPSFVQQLKGWVDVVELGLRYRRLKGLNSLFGMLLKLKRIGRKEAKAEPADAVVQEGDTHAMMIGCDMARCEEQPLTVARWLLRVLPRAGIGRQRLRNYLRLEQMLAGRADVRPLLPRPAGAGAPYVFPLWVESPEQADFVYLSLRRQGFAVFRWDRIWPDTPHLAGDHGRYWNRQVLQLLCHQDLDDAMIERSALALIELLDRSPSPAGAEARLTSLPKP